MKLIEKLKLFKEKKINAIILPNGNTEKIGIFQKKFLTNCIFERNIAISSPILSNSKNTFIGHRSYMNDGGYIRDDVFIGRYCSIGRRVSIGAGNHPMHSLSTSPSVRNKIARPYSETDLAIIGIDKINRSKSTVIMNDIWIGDGSVIVTGVNVGTGAIIGANSVVVKDVPPYAVIGGCPAKIIKYRFKEEVILDLLLTEWWELSDEQLKLLPTGNVIQFIDFMKNNNNIKFQNLETYTLDNE